MSLIKKKKFPVQKVPELKEKIPPLPPMSLHF